MYYVHTPKRQASKIVGSIYQPIAPHLIHQLPENTQIYDDVWIEKHRELVRYNNFQARNDAGRKLIVEIGPEIKTLKEWRKL